jgi:Helix-turn-helix domain
MPKTHNKTGRSKHEGRFVALPHSMMETKAFKGLSATAQAAWMHIAKVYNGSNNGRLAISTRRLADVLNVGRNTAARAILELVNAGFIEQTAAASFSGKRKAAEYRLTHKKCDRTNQNPSMAYQDHNRAPNVIQFERSNLCV